jgi:predicted Rossmann fold flavoprotein
MAGEPVVVVGAGAAGLMAAIFAAQNGARVVLLERTKDGGRKILISGGGRCNVLPSKLNPAQYITASSPNTLKKMLLSWPLAEQQLFFQQTLNIPLKIEPETGKMFPVSNKARDVRDTLVATARAHGTDIRFERYVVKLTPPSGNGPWRVGLDAGPAIEASAVILASGGLSVPATGSDGTGLRIVEGLGHTVHELYPALTPLTAQSKPHAELAGISLDVHLEAPLERGAFHTQGGFLFTHRGYSGPAVLDVSHVAVQARRANRRQSINVQWTELDASAWDELLRTQSQGTPAGLLRKHLPARLADMLLSEAHVDSDVPLAQLRKDQRARLVAVLTRYELPWTGDEGYQKAEVTGGGVSLAEVDPRTLESRLHPRLFLCGEMLDAFGPIGGYNFAWGWATGRAAGNAAAAASR